MPKSIRHKNLHGLGKGKIMTKDADYYAVYIYLLKEINYTFYCPPFHLQVKSNAWSKFLKAL